MNHGKILQGRFPVRLTERGQALIYLLSVLAVFMLVGLWLLDYNTAATARIRAQNAADGAALAGAQWQAKSLNAIGEINLIKAIHTLLDHTPPGDALQAQIAADPTNAYQIVQASLDTLQARIGFTGPMLAVLAAQQAAKNNGVDSDPTFTAAMQQHAELVRTTYPDLFVAPEWGDESWAESYANMLSFLADEGIAAAVDNASYYYGNLSAGAEAQRYLLNKSFYRAIAIRNWCFLEDLLMGGYEDYTYWGEISALPQATTGSEFFGLGLEFASSDALAGPLGWSPEQTQTARNYFVQELDRRSLPLHSDWPLFAPPIQWAIYSPSIWTAWEKASLYRSSLLADPREFYNYAGCDAVTAINIPHSISLAMADRGAGWTSWLVGGQNQTAVAASVGHLEGLAGSSELDVKAGAAAKPFGRLPNVSEPASTFQVVLPVFNEVRLIPIALASAYGNADPLWLIHRVEHLAYNGSADEVAYTHFGPNSLPDDCFYCQQLKQWEDSAFRQEGIEWLTATDPLTGARLHDCRVSLPSGGGAGGVPYAH